jgi:hypothetical protein
MWEECVPDVYDTIFFTATALMLVLICAYKDNTCVCVSVCVSVMQTCTIKLDLFAILYKCVRTENNVCECTAGSVSLKFMCVYVCEIERE